MTLRRSEINKLVVEGKQDLFVVAHLLDHYIVWGDRTDDWCVGGVCNYDGIDDLLGPDEIETVLLTPNLATLGIVVDANGDANLRWHQVRSHCTAQFPALPANLPPDGLIAMNERGLRLGVWIMPDNQSQGMIESLLRCCVPQAAQPVLDHALQSLTNARAIGAPVKEAHLDKAHVHTWLAWQDPPGLQLHQAVIAHVLDAASPLALPFVEWFIRLFQLDDLRRPPTP